MTDFFPPDVHLRLTGDRTLALEQRGPASSLLTKALLQHEASGGAPVQLTELFGENGYMNVIVIEGVKIVSIYAPPPIPPPEEEYELGVASSLYMLTGIARTLTEVVDEDDHHFLHEFKPTLRTSLAYDVPNSYSDNYKLGGAVAEINGYRACRFSGVMARVVQAVSGLGRIRDASGYYLTPPSAVTRHVPMVYVAEDSQTHGIYKAGTKNHWLIEISASRGILAMPLPLIPATRDARFRSRLRAKNDTGSLAIWDEFGGLPSGETFPTGTALTTAIADGKVLRLMTAADLNPYYANEYSETHSFYWSWAFSESGARADNVRYNYKEIEGDGAFSISGEHWSIRLDLSTYDLGVTAPDPVGTGSAHRAHRQERPEELLGVGHAGAAHNAVPQLHQPGGADGP
jgi:hypothetical protein